MQGLGEVQALKVDSGLGIGLGLGLGLDARVISSWKSSGKSLCCSGVSRLLLRVKTQPSCALRRVRRPGGNSRACRMSEQQGNI